MEYAVVESASELYLAATFLSKHDRYASEGEKMNCFTAPLQTFGGDTAAHSSILISYQLVIFELSPVPQLLFKSF